MRKSSRTSAPVSPRGVLGDLLVDADGGGSYLAPARSRACAGGCDPSDVGGGDDRARGKTSTLGAQTAEIARCGQIWDVHRRRRRRPSGSAASHGAFPQVLAPSAWAAIRLETLRQRQAPCAARSRSPATVWRLAWEELMPGPRSPRDRSLLMTRSARRRAKLVQPLASGGQRARRGRSGGDCRLREVAHSSAVRMWRGTRRRGRPAAEEDLLGNSRYSATYTDRGEERSPGVERRAGRAPRRQIRREATSYWMSLHGADLGDSPCALFRAWRPAIRDQ